MGDIITVNVNTIGGDDEDGNVDFENPFRYSILSSYSNGKIGFANERVDELLNYSKNESGAEYESIKKAYLDGGLNRLDSDITHWEFLQYRETVFPHMKNQYQDENLKRPNFTSFFRHKRSNRTVTSSVSDFDFRPLGGDSFFSSSTWPLDESEFFLTDTFTDTTASITWYFASPSFKPDANHISRNVEGS